eukprot:9905552-Alexandrium_andersonii.AAC.1
MSASSKASMPSQALRHTRTPLIYKTRGHLDAHSARSSQPMRGPSRWEERKLPLRAECHANVRRPMPASNPLLQAESEINTI